jgi:hypothetical protein
VRGRSFVVAVLAFFALAESGCGPTKDDASSSGGGGSGSSSGGSSASGGSPGTGGYLDKDADIVPDGKEVLGSCYWEAVLDEVWMSTSRTWQAPLRCSA